MSKVRKIIDDVRQNNGTEVDLVDKGIVNLTEAPGLCKYSRYFKEASIVREPSLKYRVAPDTDSNILSVSGITSTSVLGHFGPRSLRSFFQGPK